MPRTVTQRAIAASAAITEIELMFWRAVEAKGLTNGEALLLISRLLATVAHGEISNERKGPDEES